MRDYNQVQAQDFLGHLCKQPGITGARVTIDYRDAIPSMFNTNKLLKLDFKEYQIAVPNAEDSKPQDVAERVAPLLLTLLTEGLPLDMYDVLSVKRGDIAMDGDQITLYVSYIRDTPEQDAQPRATGTRMDDRFSPKQVSYMVERFLQWRIPQPFRPDGGISYTPLINHSTGKPFEPGPTGTNLFGANEATDMVRHMIDGMEFPADKAEEANKQPGDGHWEATAMIGEKPVTDVLYGSNSMEGVQRVVEGLMYSGAASLANFTRVDIKHSTHKHSSIIYRRDDPAADPWRRSLLNVTDKTEEWIHMTMDTPVPRRKSPEAERVEAYNNTVDRLEPNIAMIDAGAAYASGAISLKRIADAQTRIADYNERMLAKLEMPTDLKNIVEALMHPNFTQANIIAMVTAYLQKRR